MRVLIIRLELFDVPAALGHVLFCTGVLIIASACALCYDLGDGSATRPGTSHQNRPRLGMFALRVVRGVTATLKNIVTRK